MLQASCTGVETEVNSPDFPEARGGTINLSNLNYRKCSRVTVSLRTSVGQVLPQWADPVFREFSHIFAEKRAQELGDSPGTET